MKKLFVVVILLSLLTGCLSQSVKETPQEKTYTKAEIEVIINNPDTYELFMYEKPCVYAVRQIWKEFNAINTTIIDPRTTCIGGI